MTMKKSARLGLVRLGHREAGLHPALDQGDEPLLLLLFRAVLEEDRLVTGVRRNDPEQRRCANRVGQHLVHVGVLQEVEAGAAVLLRQVRRPEPGLPHLVLDLLPQLARLGGIAILETSVGPPAPELVLVREDLLVDDLRR